MRTSCWIALTLAFLMAMPIKAAQTKRLLYVVAPGVRDYLEFGGAGILVFDIDRGHTFVERIATPASAEDKPANIKGVCASATTGLLYFTTPKKLYGLDLSTKKTLWDRSLPEGCDRMAITPDGKFLYVPSFEKDTWNVVNAEGKQVRVIQTKSGAHNTVCGLDGKRMYLGGLKSNLLYAADTTSHKVVSQCGPFSGAVRPFTVNGAQTLCFVCVNGLLGFEVGDLNSGKKLHRVEVSGFKQGKVKRHGCPSHGVGLTPDEKEVWLCDAANSRLHVFDSTKMPPQQTASIALREQPGWVTFSLDGKFAYPSTGEVIDTKTKKVITSLKDEKGREVHSEKMVEIHFEGNTPVRVGDQFGVGRVVPGATSLSHPGIGYVVADKPYTQLQRGGVQAVIVDNQAVNDEVLPGHRAGYSGVGALRGLGRKENYFVPSVSGLNFEHIHDGTVQANKVLYEPRNAPMELRLIDRYTAELYQAPTPFYGLESCQRYHLLEDGTIEWTMDCVPRKQSFRNGYVGLFWASYIHQPRSGAIHFKGHDTKEKEAATRWIEAVSAVHGSEPTHVAHDDERRPVYDPKFPMSLIFNRSRYRYREPWYFGINGELAYVQMFRPHDRVRLTQSPSGGGKGNPAWDFQYLLTDYQVGKRYRMVMRASLVKFTSAAQLERDTAKHRAALTAMSGE